MGCMNIPSVKLANDVTVPLVGLGTWQMQEGAETETAVREALSVGYRLIDTAKMYGNEASVGRAVRESGIPREEIFVTTKLWPADFPEPEAAFHKSLERLGLEYVDLYLIHWPTPGMPESMWRTLEKIYKDEYARAIGVSNYGIAELEELLAYAKIEPMVNQIKFSPFDFNRELLDYCREHAIQPEAYSPLTRGRHLSHPAVQSIAEAHKKTPAQILLRWCVEHDVIAIPKSSDPERMRENIAVFDFELTANEMDTLNELDE